jgi:hypothetical protein
MFDDIILAVIAFVLQLLPQLCSLLDDQILSCVRRAIRTRRTKNEEQNFMNLLDYLKFAWRFSEPRSDPIDCVWCVVVFCFLWQVDKSWHLICDDFSDRFWHRIDFDFFLQSHLTPVCSFTATQFNLIYGQEKNTQKKGCLFLWAFAQCCKETKGT